MNRWEHIPPGPLLDRFICEKVGLHVLDGLALTKDGRYVNAWVETEHGAKPIYPFSTDLSTAFTLFSTELGLEWALFSEDEWITCELGHLNPEPPHDQELEQATELTASLAICKAWLKWQEREDHPAPELPKGL